MRRHTPTEAVKAMQSQAGSATAAAAATTTTPPTTLTTNGIGSALPPLSTANGRSETSTSTSTPIAADGLPTQFVLSMKTLFDILDDQRSGYVRLSDIERGWKDDGCKGLPRGVIEWLRNVTPPNGLLSFERFCTGLKLCLLKNQKDAMMQKISHNGATTNQCNNNNNGSSSSQKCLNKMGRSNSPLKSVRPPSAPALVIDSVPRASSLWTAPGGGGVAPPCAGLGVVTAARSMPQLSPSSDSEIETGGGGGGAPRTPASLTYHSPPPPPKPPRAGAAAAAKAPMPTPPPPHILPAISPAAAGGPCGVPMKMQPCRKAEIRHALQNWQMNVLLNEMGGQEKRKSASPGFHGHALQYPYRRGCADGGSSSSATESAASLSGSTLQTPTKKAGGAKRRDSRRHTLQNGIDYNMMMKRLRQLEEERDVLVVALNSIEKARECYLQQITNVQDKIKYLGLMGSEVEHWSDEAQQERLNFQRARILEVNRLAALAQSWDHGNYPMHLNLATRADFNKQNGLGHGHAAHGRPRSGAFLNIPPQSQSSKICDADVVY